MSRERRAAGKAMLSTIQRVTSAVPGATALKRRLRNNVTACGLTYRLTARTTCGFTVVTYHLVRERPDPYYPWGIHLPVLEAQLAMLHRFCSVLSLDEVIDRLERGRALPPRCVVLTFDDGYRDFYTLAWPLLKRYRLPATLYVAVEAIDRGLLWPDLLREAIRRTAATRLVLDTLPDEPRAFALATEAERLLAARRLDARLKAIQNDEKWRVLGELVRKLLGVPPEAVEIPGLMLSWDEVRALSRDGIAIGAHTMTHPILTRLSEDEAMFEIAESRRRLEAALGIPVRHFAYPNGQPEDFSTAIRSLVEAAGFQSACTTVAGTNEAAEDRFALKRIDGSCRESLRDLVRAMAERNGKVHGPVQFGSLRRLEPVDRNFGFGRGRPIDRYYIEDFLGRHAADIRGRVLESGDCAYTRQFGGGRVTHSDVLHAKPGNPQATLIADLACADQIPSNTFDCVILAQTLQFIYDVPAALRTLVRILKPGGVLLATAHGISQISRQDMAQWGEYWRFTSLSARRLLEGVFPPTHVRVETRGNVLATAAFLYGLATEDLRREELEHHDPDYELLITMWAVKPTPDGATGTGPG